MSPAAQAVPALSAHPPRAFRVPARPRVNPTHTHAHAPAGSPGPLLERHSGLTICVGASAYCVPDPVEAAVRQLHVGGTARCRYGVRYGSYQGLVRRTESDSHAGVWCPGCRCGSPGARLLCCGRRLSVALDGANPFRAAALTSTSHGAVAGEQPAHQGPEQRAGAVGSEGGGALAALPALAALRPVPVRAKPTS